MKIVLIVACCLVFLLGSKELTHAVTVCVINVRNCRSTVQVCGRYGSSSLCTRFSNRCALQLANCRGGRGYTEVSSTLCTGISVGRRARCNGSSTSSSTSGVLTNYLNNLLGTSAVSSNRVTPIIIRG
ncbi:uncharacterized protein LOC119669244 [Teleopsis dalmanni]|uniref:uncharacterized protein LOC119669244 n=1 Tax=Teleopsis dalmanni TaxID=139649 RepID=UPI0018CD4E13|nr:uncharacterized protein LOC119669244 [Teleopsis dalmanni]